VRAYAQPEVLRSGSQFVLVESAEELPAVRAEEATQESPLLQLLALFLPVAEERDSVPK
jgi:hypothetical protein